MLLAGKSHALATGTTNRVTVSAAQVVDISASYVGQSSITTLGTVTTGTWNGTTVDVAHGGTGLTTLPTNQIPYGNGTSAFQSTSSFTYDGLTFTIGPSGAHLLVFPWSVGGPVNAIWMDFPTTGPSGIGTGGAGNNIWLAYASSAGFWFGNSAAGDLCYRNQNGKRLIFGTATDQWAMMVDTYRVTTLMHTIGIPGAAQFKFDNYSGANTAMWMDVPITGPSGIGTGGVGVSPWIAYSFSAGQWFSDSLAGDVNVKNNTASKRLNFGNSSGAATAYILGDKLFHGASSTTTASLNIVAGTAPTSPAEGDIWADTTRKAIVSFTDGIKQTLPGVLFTQTADQTVTNTVTETTIIGSGVGSLTLPGGFFVVGKALRIRIGGIYSTPAVATPSVIVKIKLSNGPPIIAQVTTSSLLSGAASLEFDGEVLITCRTTGASGTVVAHGDIEYSTGVAGTIAVDSLNNAGATSVVDTTKTNVIDITVTWDSATTTRIAKSTTCTVEVLN